MGCGCWDRASDARLRDWRTTRSSRLRQRSCEICPLVHEQNKQQDDDAQRTGRVDDPELDGFDEGNEADGPQTPSKVTRTAEVRSRTGPHPCCLGSGCRYEPRIVFELTFDWGKRRRITLQKKGMSKTKYHLVERLAASGDQRSSFHGTLRQNPPE